MIRYNVLLTERQIENLRTIAGERVSVSEHIRRAIDIYIEDHFAEVIQNQTIRLLTEKKGTNANDKPNPKKEGRS